MKKLALLLAVMLLISAFVGCASPSAPAAKPAEKTVWKVACMGSDTHPSTIGAKKFEEEIEKRIGEEVDVQIFINGQLGTQPDQQIGGLQQDIIQFCDISTGNVTGFSKAFIPLDVPYLFLSRDAALAFVDGEMGQKMKERYEQESDIRLLCFFDYGFREVTNSKRAITQPSDLSGLKIRTLSNPIHMEAFTAFGALPTPMAYSEVTTALQQGTVDGQENPTSSIWDAKFYEVQKYLSMTDHVYGFLGFHMSATYYNGLSDAWKKAIDESAAIAQAEQREVCNQQNIDALQKIKDSGVTAVNELTEDQKLAFRELSKSAWDMAAEQCGADYFNEITTAAKALE